MSLTDAAIRNAKPREKAYKMYDADGLFVIVTPKGGKWWRVKYTMQGKECLLSLGTYPKIGLAEARKRRDEVKSSVANGQDPSVQRKEARAVAVETVRHQEATFEAVAREWFAIASPDLTPKYAAKMMGYLERVFFPAIGGKLVADLLPVDILNIGHKEQRAGRIYTAHKLTYLAGQVLQYAFIKGLARSMWHGALQARCNRSMQPTFLPSPTPRPSASCSVTLMTMPGTHPLSITSKSCPMFLLAPGSCGLPPGRMWILKTPC